MRRLCLLAAILVLGLSNRAQAITFQPGLHDEAFGQLPFNEWRAAGKHSGIPWEVETEPARLSNHQRMEAVVRISISTRYLARRSENTELLALVEVEDERGVRWQTHEFVRTTSWEQHAFFLPGDYVWSAALWDASSHEYSFVRRKVHVRNLKTDPLAGSWSDLPEVEFFRAPSESPDSWFLPEVTTRMRLRIATGHKAHVTILLNTSPTGRWAGSIAELRRNMTALIPALKVISQIQIEGGSMDVSLLDLTHGRVSFAQKDVRELDWNGMREIFAAANPGIVDASVFATESRIHSFFHDALGRAMGSASDGIPNPVIVLSGPAFFEDRYPVSFADLPKDPDHRVYYIRYRPIPPESFSPSRRTRTGRPILPPQRPMFYFAIPVDDLERPLETINARIYDAISPEQFRRILGAVMAQISRL